MKLSYDETLGDLEGVSGKDANHQEPAGRRGSPPLRILDSQLSFSGVIPSHMESGLALVTNLNQRE